MPFLINGAGLVVYSQAKTKAKTPEIQTKVNLQWTMDLNVKYKTTKLLGKKKISEI